MPLHVLNTIAPAPGKKQRVQGILQFLVNEMQRNEPDALQVQVLWDELKGVFHIVEVFADENARNNHHNMPYTTQLRQAVQEDQLFAGNMESRVVDGLVGFSRKQVS
ncbi:hypothetical protein B0J12DRAFT_690992 [Macrophomina phaseolina]|uniref:ABM domain-containing protein n=1 Tax=Macrophomina phaseolina TaxID=35725 RepID=A0ABQ8FQA5_9PEZI|nr:hypothetical protein B0J12DRAFT_690992 [Macrophomina phaseolina]